MEAREKLLRYCIKYKNDGDKVHKALVNKREVDETFDISNKKFISVVDAEYPKQLKETIGLHKSFVLYYEGDKKLLNNIDDMIFLYGRNVFDIPEEKLITIKDGVVDLGGRLKIWFNNVPRKGHRFVLAACLCQRMVITKVLPFVDGSSVIKYSVGYSVNAMLLHGGEIYVTPTKERSLNNQLIKEGAFLIDCVEDLEAVKK